MLLPRDYSQFVIFYTYTLYLYIILFSYSLEQKNTLALQFLSVMFKMNHEYLLFKITNNFQSLRIVVYLDGNSG